MELEFIADGATPDENVTFHMYVSSAPCGNSTIRKWAAPTFGERYEGRGWPGCWHAEMERVERASQEKQGDRDQEHGGEERNNVSSSSEVEAAREARREARREKQRAKKVAKAARMPDPPRCIEKSRSVHEGVALSKGACSFRLEIKYEGIPQQKSEPLL